MSDLQPMTGVPFAQQPYAFRLREHVKSIEGFVTAYTDLHPDVLKLPEAIDWFVAHSTNLQAESPDTITEVRRQVAERVNPS